MAPRPSLDDDFVFTISDHDDISVQEDEDDISSGAEQNGLKRKRGSEPVSENDPTEKRENKKQKKGKNGNPTANGATLQTNGDDEKDWTMRGKDNAAMNLDFEFQLGNVDSGVVEDFDGWGGGNLKKEPVKQGNKKGVDIDDLIARRRERQQSQSRKKIDLEDGHNNEEEEIESVSSEGEEPVDQEALSEDDELMAPDGFGMGANGEDESMDGNVDVEEDGEEEDAETSDSDNESIAAPVAHPNDVSSDDEAEVDPEEKAREDAFFAPQPKSNKSTQAGRSSFQTMSLSRPILRGLASVGFVEPTPIQAKTIPIALLGKDVVGGAVTGSGKTGAFMIPILERLLYRPRRIATSRVVILMPTRELAVQCFNVAKKLASFTDITFCQLVGGFSLREQEIVLRGRPDVIIATPGRFIDHMRNSPSFTVDTLEILVLDEADRMLEDGFADELNEILTTIPKSRQTMLFSATMTSSVDKLIRVGLNQPVRLMVDARKQTVTTLTQEFLRLRPGREDKRLAYLLHLCTAVYTSRCIIFFRQKKEAHRVRIIFSLFGFKAAELHGSMSQEQRIASIESFRSNAVTHLLATDVASRGLDIKGVEVVLNYSAPQSHEIYLHRVGRTARAGRVGRACTIAAEPDRKVVKAAVKTARTQGAKVVSRTVDASIADDWQRKIDELEEEVEAILEEEKEEKELNSVEMQVKKGENLMDYEDEIKARPKRTWFESEKKKKLAKERGAVELNGESAGKRKKLKLSNKQKKKLDGNRDRVEGRMWKKGKGDAPAKPGNGTKKGAAGKTKPNTKKKIKGGRR